MVKLIKLGDMKWTDCGPESGKHAICGDNKYGRLAQIVDQKMIHWWLEKVTPSIIK